MPLYRKLAYAGSIIGLLKHGSTFGIIVVISYLLPESRQLAVLMESSPEMTFLMGFGLWSGIVGAMASTLAIIVTRKVSHIQKKLFVTLFLTGFILLGISLASFSFISGVIDDTVATQQTNVWSAIIMSGQDMDMVNEGMNQQLLIEIIPSVLLLASGLFAFRMYRKNRNYLRRNASG